MKINNKEFDEWLESDLQAIIENDAYRENEIVDYKENFAILECGNKEDKRKKQNEFRHDVCSFANADGGYLIFGISESAGVPSTIKGITISDIDRFELDRRNELAGIYPHSPCVKFSFIKISDEKYVVVIKIFRGVHKPYLFKENEDSYKFYVRRGNKKQFMSYVEIRDNFLLSDQISTAIRRFRKERLFFYAEEYSNIPFALIQVIPADFLNAPSMTIWFDEYKENKINFDELFNGLYHGDVCPNVDGVCFQDFTCDYDYGLFLQIFNNGISELFYEVEVRKNGDNYKWIFVPQIIDKMKALVKDTIDLYTKCKKYTMVYVCVTISGCKGVWNDLNRYITNNQPIKIDRNEINCMPIEISDITDEAKVDEAVNMCEKIINYSVGKRR